MSRFPDPFLAAAVQWAPSVNDATEGTRRACDALTEAAALGAKLVAFPETWLNGYPYWEGLGPHPDYFTAYTAYVEAAIELDGPEITTVRECAADLGLHVVIGANERDPRSSAVYNALIYIGGDGTLLGRHRKMMATITEKLVWTNGDGSDLAAYDTPVGRLGGLICYEHQMAPARFVCCDLGVQVHVAVWPGHAFLDPVVDAAIRHLSVENGCFVISPREVMSASRLPAGSPFADHPFAWEAHGGSSIVAPGATYVAEPVFDVETIVTGVIDVKALLESKWWTNGVGNYSRPDIFTVTWHREPKPAVRHDPPS